MSAVAQAYLDLLLQTQFLPPEKLMAYQASLVEPLDRYHSDDARTDAHQ
jgi:hypothetical protein